MNMNMIHIHMNMIHMNIRYTGKYGYDSVYIRGNTGQRKLVFQQV